MSADAQPSGRRVALVHHWLVRRRGGEKVLDSLARLLPGADLFTLVHDAKRCPAPEGVAGVTTSPMQHLPFASRGFRALLPLLPRFYGAMDLSGHDLVVSSDAALAKTVRVPERAKHLCYCYSPPRWAWDLEQTYLEQRVPAPARPAARRLLQNVRKVDRKAADRVTRFVAISEHVARRIERCYERESEIVHPPVDTAFFTPGDEDDAPRASFPDGAPRPYLLLGEAVAYKRFDLAVDACRELGRPLVVAGGGPMFSALRRRAGPQTHFVPDPDDEQVRALYRECRALLFPGEEDFGLVPVEAMACGRPVIALGVGGATETVVDGETGCLYPEHTAEALAEAVKRFESIEATLTAAACIERAAVFGTARFEREMAAQLAAV
ncbi:MAG: glycosyltransferase [Planctomycetota bacterium]